MDWFHCNVCHMRQETAYYITSCGHILCKTCITQDLCSVCKTACKYLPISDNAWRFQKQQHELHVTFYKQCLNKAQDAFQVALLKIETQQSELKTIKKENDELRSMVTQLKSSISRSQSSSRSTTPRPIAITPPSQTVTPQHNFHQYGQMNSHSSSAESPYVRSQSGTGSQSATSSRVQERTTPMSSSSSFSGHSLSSRDRTSTSSNLLDTPNESSNIQTTNSAFARDSLYTPCNNIDRLRAIQLKFTPRMPRLFSFQR
ncbi:E3 ubiquitin-protein ligase RNF212B isoform X2 [Ranitomeya variabilis]|uniref:E3 ubiquitin-protein ligase RNF212B isoform X2 n=1 Tax=Ranitomeya variabilis TaxID=490064 RepID=UPI004055B1D2